MICQINKESCSHCLKSVNTGHPFFECFICNSITHSKCLKASKAETLESVFYCIACKPRKAYNPFRALIDEDSDEHTVLISNILDRCKTYSCKETKSTILETEHECRMIFQNVDGNKSNFDSFVVGIESTETSFPIIGLAETNTSPDESSVYTISGYNSYYQDTLENKSKGTGVALYISQSFNAVVNYQVSHVSPNLETLFVNITSKQGPTVIGVVYRPPSGDFNQALKELHDILEKLPKSRTHVMGDFNINLHSKTLASIRVFEEEVLGLGFTPLISTLTHEKPGCEPSCIDNILTNSPENTIASGTIALGVSHHHAVFQLFNGIDKACSNEERTVQYYDYCKSNVDKFEEQLKKSLISSNPPEFSSFYEIFNAKLESAFKLDRPKSSKRNSKANPWITPSVIAAVRNQNGLYKMWHKAKKRKCLLGRLDNKLRDTCACQNCVRIPITYKKYRDYRKFKRQLIKETKRKYYGRKLGECQGDSKKTWRIINELRGKIKRTIKPSFIVDSVKVTNRRVIANEFIKHYSSVAPKLNKAYTDDQGNLMSGYEQYLPKRNEYSMFLEDCNPDEIMKIISELQNGKSSDIPIHIIKNTSHIITPYLVEYFNVLMQDGVFPDELKVGRITPIYKKDNEELIENYRPVSTLPVFGKIFEKIIYSRLYSFLTSKGLIYEKQFGFRKGHSTTHAINYSVNHVLNELRNKKHVLGIFIDLSKAFDTLAHDRLLRKLDQYGIRGSVLSLIKSYLSYRSQYVSVLDETSETMPVLFGVPQGSVLGPLLFLVYINDLCNVTEGGELVLFADDSNVFVAADSKKAAYEAANALLDKIYQYMASNLLHINSKKCCFIDFGPHKPPDEVTDDLQLCINNKAITRVNQTKFLGVIIDEHLSWQPHIDSLNRKLKSACGRIYRIISSLPERLHKDIYYTLFESHLSYAISVWGGVSKSRLEPLFRTQKKCLRIMFGDVDAFKDKFNTCARSRPYPDQKLGRDFYMREPSKPIFNKTEILTVHNVYRQRCVMETYKVVKYRMPITVYTLFDRSSRRDDRLILPFPNSGFIYRSSALWNKAVQATGPVDMALSFLTTKSIFCGSILTAQKRYSTVWCDLNFTEFAG